MLSLVGRPMRLPSIMWLTRPEAEIRYVIVTSLYTTVNKYDEYPIGHPTIITHPEEQDIALYFGLAKGDILPPRGLYHPVLPALAN